MKKKIFGILFFLISAFSFASCEKPAKTYTITWENWDGSLLRTTEVNEGEMPVYDGATPRKDPTVSEEYTFNGWSPEVVKATCDTSYTATYSPSIRKYTIYWYNDENDTELLHKEDVQYNDTPKYHWKNKPTKAETDRKRYDWNGWEETVVPVRGEARYHAHFDEVNKYKVTFKNYDGTVLQESYVASDTMPIYEGDNPTRSPDAQYTYEPLGWDRDIVKPTSDTVYIYTYEPVVNKYKITWKGGINGDVLLKEETLAYGATPTAPTNVPGTLTEGIYKYTFLNSWSPVVTTVTGEATYVAQYKQELLSFDITWKNYDGTTLQSDSVSYGATPLYTKDDPTKVINGHSFEWLGWNKDVLPVTQDETYTAVFDNDITFDFEGINCTINGKTEFTDVYTFDESDQPASIDYVIKSIGTYSLPDTISVYVDDNLVSSDKYTYSKTTGAFSIASNLGNIRLKVVGA